MILSDHKPLVWLSNIKEPNMKLQRWKIRLGEHDFKIKYLEGSKITSPMHCQESKLKKYTMAVTKQQHVALRKIMKI